MRWLDDDELKACFDSGDPGQITEALVVMEDRLGIFDLPNIPPITLQQLAPVAHTDDYTEGARMVELVLRQPSPDADCALDTVANLSAAYLGVRPQFAVALELKVQPDPPHAITRVLSTLGAQLDHLPPERALPIGFLIDNLLDGNPEVVAATWAALRAWPPGPMRDAVLRAAEVDLEAGRRSFQQRQVGG